MQSDTHDAVVSAIRHWLRNERRLGVQHVGATLAPASTPSTPSSGQRAASARPVTSRPRATSAASKPADGQPPAEPQLATNSVHASDSDLPPPCDRDLAVADAEQALREFNEQHVQGCTKCRLHTHRNKIVFGDGRARPEIVFVGEGPGADEDAQGIPFVGRAGQLLTKMIEAMTLTRDQVYICNVVKCRPPGNRTPTEDEMQTCLPYLVRQLAIQRPKVIVTLGRPASQTLLATKTPIGKLRGRFHEFPPPPLADLGLPTCKLMPTFHPAYLLRSPGEKRKAWEDLQQVMAHLGLPHPS